MTHTDPHPIEAAAGRALRAHLDAALAARDKSAAVTAAIEAVDTGAITIPALYAVLGALLADVGARWQTGEECVWEEHLASSTIRTIVEALYPRVSALAQARGHDRGTALLTCPPHEAHDLGLRMLADRLELAGWRVHFLGADTPEGDIVLAAKALEANAVVLSLSTHFHRVAFRSLLDGLRAALPGVRILAGGPAVPRGEQGIPAADLFDSAGLLGPGE
jgi:methanogenic corrinoid protein MtbC1